MAVHTFVRVKMRSQLACGDTVLACCGLSEYMGAAVKESLFRVSRMVANVKHLLKVRQDFSLRDKDDSSCFLTTQGCSGIKVPGFKFFCLIAKSTHSYVLRDDAFGDS